tara:strand:- start:418 stop:609 length:192 start_codon:yes stop_codon:yes gene_type:complete
MHVASLPWTPQSTWQRLHSDEIERIYVALRRELLQTRGLCDTFRVHVTLEELATLLEAHATHV